MRKDVRQEESLIFNIYNNRHQTNEIVTALPFILALAFSIIGAPIILAAFDLPFFMYPVLILGPIFLVLIFYLIRKKIIFDGFLKIRDISDRVELTDIQSHVFEAEVKGKVFMFPFSEYMEVILYNWFYSLNVIQGEKLKMYKVFYDNYAPTYLAVCEADIFISEESKEKYEKETCKCLLLSDMMNGKAVNVKIYERVKKI